MAWVYRILSSKTNCTLNPISNPITYCRYIPFSGFKANCTPNLTDDEQSHGVGTPFSGFNPMSNLNAYCRYTIFWLQDKLHAKPNDEQSYGLL